MKPTLLVLCALLASESFACSCIAPDMASFEKGAELVVLAQMKSSSPSFGTKKYTFATIKKFKGVAGERIVVWTPKLEASCGLRARRDVPYVLFVYREDDKLMVDHCSSWPLAREYAHFTAVFNEFYGLTGAEALEPAPTEYDEYVGRDFSHRKGMGPPAPGAVGIDVRYRHIGVRRTAYSVMPATDSAACRPAGHPFRAMLAGRRGARRRRETRAPTISACHFPSPLAHMPAQIVQLARCVKRWVVSRKCCSRLQRFSTW